MQLYYVQHPILRTCSQGRWSSAMLTHTLHGGSRVGPSCQSKLLSTALQFWKGAGPDQLAADVLQEGRPVRVRHYGISPEEHILQTIQRRCSRPTHDHAPFLHAVFPHWRVFQPLAFDSCSGYAIFSGWAPII